MTIKKNQDRGKQGLVICKNPEQYEVFDQRIMKPICIKKVENGVEIGSMVFQELDTVDFPKNPLTYFPPNNVALLLSISKRHLTEAERIFSEKLEPTKNNHSFVDTTKNKKDFLNENSVIVADYIENIQTSIVFAYTALEAFTNLSIPDDYEYKMQVKSKGIIELYDKKAIERWLPLKDKISNILTIIYETKKVETQKFWSNLVNLEKLRHEIIHQKSIERTEFYKAYFGKDIFKSCKSAEETIKFFFETHSDKKKTNPLWPWLINKDKEFPLTLDFKSEHFEVIGNLYEGLTK